MAYTATPRNLGAPDMWQKTQVKSPSTYQAGTPVSYANYAPAPVAAAPKPPAATPTPQQPQQPAATPQAAGSYDYSMDPILNQILASSRQQRSSATSNAEMLRKQAEIDYNDPSNPFSIVNQNKMGYERGTRDLTTGYQRNTQDLDTGYQRNTQDLDTSYQRNTQDLDTNYGRQVERTREDYNKRNLFWGGHYGQAKEREASDYNTTRGRYTDDYNTTRGRYTSDYQTDLGDSAWDYQRDQYGAGREYQGTLGQINSDLVAALLGADQADIGGQGDAYGRALQFALTNGIDPGAALAQEPLAQQLAAPPPPVSLAPAQDELALELARQLLRGTGGRNFQAA